MHTDTATFAFRITQLRQQLDDRHITAAEHDELTLAEAAYCVLYGHRTSWLPSGLGEVTGR